MTRLCSMGAAGLGARALARAISVLLLLLPPTAHATVYTWRDESGALVVTNDANALPSGGGDSVQTYTTRTPKRSAGQTGAPEQGGSAKASQQLGTERVERVPGSDGPGQAEPEREAEAYRRGFEQGREAAQREAQRPAQPTQAVPQRARASERVIAPRERPPFVVRVIPRPPHPFSTTSSAEPPPSSLEAWAPR